VRHGVVILPEHQAARARVMWNRAEELGFDHAWVYDHLAWRSLRTQPWYGSVPTLGIAASATTRMMLGTMVVSPSIRHPVTLAKDLVTLDDASQGRIICGVGAGAGGFDDELMGVARLSPRQRTERFAEFVELLDRLLRSEEVDHRGRFYVSRGHLRPGCVQRPRLPIAVAATGPRGMRLAARYAEIWVTAGVAGWREPARFDRTLSLLEQQLKAAEDACHQVGRDPSTLRRLVVTGAMIAGVTESVGSYQEACGSLERAGFTDLVVHWPRDSMPYEGRMDVLESIAGEVLSRRSPT
jgi:alkanesulfonate monooxygenase SsuD/methylene tetrahydromethanopterin reductase-like flavin-dependent oxidoreductase (luciferase family)